MLLERYRKYEKELFKMVDSYVRNSIFFTNDEPDIDIDSMLDSQEYVEIAVKLFSLDFEDSTDIVDEKAGNAFKLMVLDPDTDNKSHFATIMRDNLLNKYESTIKHLIQERFDRIASEL